jgi:16S rRNA (adenine1518-N6/adenine1519-N6)-dimethyltransferase
VESEPSWRRPPSTERAWLTAHDVRPKRRLGQNFLLDPRVLQETVRRAAWPVGARLVEIGPGGGALTAELLSAGFEVTAVEIDVDLVGLLHERFATEVAGGRLRVVHGDILDVPWEPFLDPTATSPGPPGSARPEAPAALGGRPWIVGNLPYGVTTPILLRVLAHAEKLDGAVIMVQREYGERLLARAGEDAYSSISVRTAAQARGRQLLLVGRSAFWPRPGVESLVIELMFPRPAPYAGSIGALERVLRAGFGQRRKTLENALAHGLGRTKDEARSMLKRAGCDPGARAETLPLDRFAALASLVDEA